MTVTLHIPQARSLKDKRQVIRGLVEVIRRKFNVSIAELDDLDLHQRATVGVVCLSNDVAHVHRVLEGVRAVMEADADAIVCEVAVEML